MEFSVVVPLFNESARIDKNIKKIFDFFKELPEIEIIFVNDGSTDDTLQKLKNYNSSYGFEIITYEDNHGKGYAVRKGAMAAKGDWVLFFDIDLATPLEEFYRLKENLSGFDVIIGSRRLKSSSINNPESRLRTFLGQCFTKISNILVPGITDFTCGFKCFSNASAKEIFSLARIDRWGFDTEILFISYLKKKKILQIPVSWSHDSDSRVNVVGAIASSFNDLLAIKLNDLRGFYK